MPPANVGERIPTLPTPEAGIETGAERVEQAAEASARAADAASTGAPQVAAPAAADPAVTQAIASSPTVAADEDVIEKEWVDKAKEIIETTRDDPYQRSTQVNQLHEDYLKKRYGKVLGTSE
jgi:hypothetical protein